MTVCSVGLAIDTQREKSAEKYDDNDDDYDHCEEASPSKSKVIHDPDSANVQLYAAKSSFTRNNISSACFFCLSVC